jgi:hypothetical protein
VGGDLGVGLGGELDAGRLALGAQRVCPMPIVDSGRGESARAFSRLASLPAFFAVACPPSARTATPAES